MARSRSASEEDLVRIDERGVAHPLGGAAKRALQRHENRTLRLMACPAHVVVLRSVERAPEPADRRLWLSGEIGRAGRLVDIMNMVAQARWRGELLIDDERERRSIFVHAGHVIGASSTARHERLGAMLRQFGEMTDEQIDMASREVSADTRFGDAAVRLGFLGQETLFRYLHRQTEEIVYAAMALGRGSFSFYEHIDELPLTFPLRMSLFDLMFEGVTRMDTIESCRERVPSNQHVPVRVEGRIVDAGHQAYAVYLAVNGERTVEEIAAASGKGLFVAIRDLDALERCGAIALGPPRRAGPERAVAVFNQALSVIFAELHKYPAAAEGVVRSLGAFTESSPIHAALLAGAGPRPDGTFDADRILANLQGIEEATSLPRWLHDHASYALFVAEPVMRAGAGSDAAAVSSKVARILAPIAPDF